MNQSYDFERIVRILAVNRNAIFREGLRSFIEAQPNLRLVGSLGDAGTALALFAESQPDLTLLDLNLPFGRATELIREIRSVEPDAWIIGLVTYEWDECGAEALAAGAAAVVSKDLVAERLLSLVDAGPAKPSQPVPQTRERWRTYLRGLFAHSDLRA